MKTPLYIQVAKDIRTYILEHNLKAGDALPPERHLCESTGKSRVTVRKALDKLAKDKIVQRKQGAGTFVLPLLEHLETDLTGFTGNALSHGQTPHALWIMKAYGIPTSEEAKILKISQTEKVVRLGRVRLTNNQPLAIEHAIVPAVLLPEIEEISESLYQALRTKNNQPVTGTQKVHASLANSTEAGLLSIQENSAVLRIERRSFLKDGTPVELTRSAYRSDRYDFIMELESAQLD